MLFKGQCQIKYSQLQLDTDQETIDKVNFTILRGID